MFLEVFYGILYPHNFIPAVRPHAMVNYLWICVVMTQSRLREIGYAKSVRNLKSCIQPKNIYILKLLYYAIIYNTYDYIVLYIH